MAQDAGPLGVAVIGTGMVARTHLLAIRDARVPLRLISVQSRNPERARSFANEAEKALGHEVGVSQDLVEIGGDDRVDIALVLTPPDARRAVIEPLARAGKAILLEKPVGRTLEEAREVVTTCDEAQVPLGVVFQHRMREASVAARDIVAGDALGALGLAEIAVPWWRDQRYYDEPGRGTYARDGGGVLMTQAIHALDLMLSYTGPVTEVQAICANTMHRMEAEDFAAGALRFENGATGSFMATVTCYPGAEARLTLNCDRATAILEGGRLDVFHHSGERREFTEPKGNGSGASLMDFPCDWHKALIEDFMQAVRDGRAPASNGHSALNVHALIDAVTRSSASGKRELVTRHPS